MADREGTVLNELILQLLDGTIGDEELSRLNNELADNPEALRRYSEFMMSHAALRHRGGVSAAPDGLTRGSSSNDYEDLLRLLGQMERTAPVDEILGEAIERDKQVRAGDATRLDDAQKEAIRKAAEGALERFIIEERRRQEELAYKLYISRRRSLALGIGSLAALLVVCVWLLVPRPHLPTPTTATAAPAVATMIHAYEARWDLAHIAPIVGTELTSGPIKLIEGLVEIRFKTGARVIVEAPAEMNLVDERTAYLTSGALTAYVPEPVTGFVVETPSVRVTDLGTQFGLLAYEGGATDVHMLSGSVRALFRGAEGDELPYPRHLYRNDAMSFDAAAGKVSHLDLDRERFALSWDDVLYKPRISGAIKFQRSVPSSLREDAVQSDRSIHLFLEATDVSLIHDVTVDINEPRQYQGHQGLFLAIQAGLKVDSYLVHWDPASSDELTRIASGSVTFRRPIVGLIFNEGRLSATDSLFGAAATEYATYLVGRGLETGTGGDSVALSQDRLTLQLELRAPSALDEIRILVAAATAKQQ